MTRLEFLKNCFLAALAPMALRGTSELAENTKGLNGCTRAFTPEGNTVMVYGGGKNAQRAIPKVLSADNWKQSGRPRVILDGEDVTHRAQVAQSGDRGFVVLLHEEPGMARARVRHWVIETVNGVNQPKRTLAIGKVEFKVSA